MKPVCSIVAISWDSSGWVQNTVDYPFESVWRVENATFWEDKLMVAEGTGFDWRSFTWKTHEYVAVFRFCE